jgi:hypothetical protein
LKIDFGILFIFCVVPKIEISQMFQGANPLRKSLKFRIFR